MKNWILRWLGLAPKHHEQDNNYAPSLATVGGGHNPQLFNGMMHRNYFEIIEASNGKIVVYTRHVSNPNGPDKNDMEVYIVPEGESLMDTVTAAVVAARLK